MKSLTILFRHAPHSTAHGREGLDLALLSASFEQTVRLIFVDEGVLHLIDNQDSELIDTKDYIATLKALPLYDIEEVYACQQSCMDLSLDPAALRFNAQPLLAKEISQQLSVANEVLVF